MTEQNIKTSFSLRCRQTSKASMIPKCSPFIQLSHSHCYLNPIWESIQFSIDKKMGCWHLWWCSLNQPRFSTSPSHLEGTRCCPGCNRKYEPEKVIILGWVKRQISSLSTVSGTWNNGSWTSWLIDHMNMMHKEFPKHLKSDSCWRRELCKWIIKRANSVANRTPRRSRGTAPREHN